MWIRNKAHCGYELAPPSAIAQYVVAVSEECRHFMLSLSLWVVSAPTMQFPSQKDTAIGVEHWQILTLNKLSEVWTLEQGGAGMCTIATSSSNYTKERKIIFCHLLLLLWCTSLEMSLLVLLQRQLANVDWFVITTPTKRHSHLIFHLQCDEHLHSLQSTHKMVIVTLHITVCTTIIYCNHILQ